MKNQQLIINHKDVLNPKLVYWKDVNWILITKNYLIRWEKDITVKFKDSFCKYEIKIDNTTFQPQYKINLWYNKNKNECVYQVNDNIKKFVQVNTTKIESFNNEVNIWTITFSTILFSILISFLAWIVFFNNYLNKRRRYLNIK